MLSIIRLPKLKKQSKKLVYNNLKKIIFLLFLCFSYSLNGQSNLLIKEEINGSFSQGTMNGAIDRYFSDDTYYLRSNFNIKIFRLINIKREEGYIVSLKDSTITRINHRKKKFVTYTVSKFLEDIGDENRGGPPDNDEDETDDLDVVFSIAEEIEIVNNFETKKATITVEGEEEEIELFLWFTEKTLNSPIVGSTRKKLENLFGGTIPPNLGFEQIPIPFEKGGINKDALIVKYQTTVEDGTFNYVLFKYSKNDLLPDIFQIPKEYKKVKKL